LLLLLNYVVLRALWKIDVNLISTLVNKSLYYYLYYYFRMIDSINHYNKTDTKALLITMLTTYSIDYRILICVYVKTHFIHTY